MFEGNTNIFLLNHLKLSWYQLCDFIVSKLILYGLTYLLTVQLLK